MDPSQDNPWTPQDSDTLVLFLLLPPRCQWGKCSLLSPGWWVRSLYSDRRPILPIGLVSSDKKRALTYSVSSGHDLAGILETQINSKWKQLWYGLPPRVFAGPIAKHSHRHSTIFRALLICSLPLATLRAFWKGIPDRDTQLLSKQNASWVPNQGCSQRASFLRPRDHLLPPPLGT